ncbi:MAG: mannose-1-phosphate guanylyltransferase/mannose-6-phosphate isomerase [Rhizobiales bacterium]|nr:mannose-1-phosphate guanylyltransferase/mannose-6-phosphate isomerase [Hyphomicrobiales bacterium]
MTTIRPVILCGGAGARLWPASRDTMPKQFAALLGERSTFQETVLRAGACGFGRPLIVTNQAHRFLAERQLADLSIAADILIEPSRRDSGPAIAAACLALTRSDPDGLALVLASDHVVRDTQAFHHAIAGGVAAAEAGRLVTFGVVPTRPETGYGYVEPGCLIAGAASTVVRFAEKPCVEKAAEYVAAGLLWNSGNFLFRADALLGEYRRFDPETLAALCTALGSSTASGGAVLLGPEYAHATAQSIDYAVMEKTSRAAVVRLSCGWSDVGSWDALWGLGAKDADGNVTNGVVELLGSRGCYVMTNGPLVSLLDLDGVVVVATDDAVLVADRRRSGEVKQLVEQLRCHGRSQADAHSRVHRPWGWYRVLDGGNGFQVKRIVVHPGGRLSLQKHRHRAEHWVVVCGEATVTVDDRREIMRSNEHVHIPLGAVHRLENFGVEPVELVEVQSGSYLGEDDIVRLEDVYNRT